MNEYDYDGFGVILNERETITNAYKFHGEYMDEDTGLYYLRVRWYDVDTGRFYSMDEFEGVYEEPESLHKYVFAGNDGVNRVDYSGMMYVGGEVGGVRMSEVMGERVRELLRGVVIPLYKYVLNAKSYIRSNYDSKEGYKGMIGDEIVYWLEEGKVVLFYMLQNVEWTEKSKKEEYEYPTPPGFFNIKVLPRGSYSKKYKIKIDSYKEEGIFYHGINIKKRSEGCIIYQIKSVGKKIEERIEELFYKKENIKALLEVYDYRQPEEKVKRPLPYQAELMI